MCNEAKEQSLTTKIKLKKRPATIIRGTEKFEDESEISLPSFIFRFILKTAGKSNKFNFLHTKWKLYATFSAKRDQVADMELRPVRWSVRNLESTETSPSSLARKLNEMWDF